MLSRRNIRIKIMQVRYAVNRQEDFSDRRAMSMYRDLVDRSFQVYLFNLLIMQRVAEYARQDEARKRSKHLPSDEDKAFTAKMATNRALASLSENQGLRTLYDRYHLGQALDADQVHKLYRAFTKEEEHVAYLAKTDTTPADDIQLLLALYRWLIKQEIFEAMVEDRFPLWDDDRSLVNGAMKKTIKALPAREEFYEAYRKPVDAVTEFGETLLKYLGENDTALTELIQPTLENWDVERVATIDMILIKMAVAEFTQFPTIPTKVTFNEYVDISKRYSTDKSKEFVNGVLDKLLKQLQAGGMVQKQGRGLIE